MLQAGGIRMPTAHIQEVHGYRWVLHGTLSMMRDIWLQAGTSQAEAGIT